jgi:hypothetical protein
MRRGLYEVNIGRPKVCYGLLVLSHTMVKATCAVFVILVVISLSPSFTTPPVRDLR